MEKDAGVYGVVSVIIEVHAVVFSPSRYGIMLTSGFYMLHSRMCFIKYGFDRAWRSNK